MHDTFICEMGKFILEIDYVFLIFFFILQGEYYTLYTTDRPWQTRYHIQAYFLVTRTTKKAWIYDSLILVVLARASKLAWPS